MVDFREKSEPQLPHLSSELKKGSILVSRIPNISGRKSGHFRIVAINLTTLDQKGYKNYNL